MTTSVQDKEIRQFENVLNSRADSHHKGWASESIVVPEGYERKRTPGEKKFDRIVYRDFGFWATLVASVGIAYLLKDSNIKNPFSKRDPETGEKKSWRESYDATTERAGVRIQNLLKLKDKKDKDDKIIMSGDKRAHAIADNILLTTVTFVGGFIPLPFIRRMERNKQKLVHKYNERIGTPTDVAMGDLNVQDEAPQSMMSLMGSRLLSWLVVFISFGQIGGKTIPETFGGIRKDAQMGAMKVANLFNKFPGRTKDKLGFQDYAHTGGKNRQEMEEAEDKLLDKIIKDHGLDENEKEPLGKKMRFAKRIGDLLGLDAFATAMSVALLYVFSKTIGKMMHKKQEQKRPEGITLPPESQLIAKNTIEKELATQEIDTKKIVEDARKKNIETAKARSQRRWENFEAAASASKEASRETALVV